MEKDLREGLRAQMVFEMDSAYIYLGMAAWFTNNNWNGFSKFMYRQAKEEVEHAMKIYKFLGNLGSEIFFDALNAPERDYKSVEEVFEAAFEHEKLVTSNINALYERAVSEKNYAVERFLGWFVEEQVEEEATFNDITTVLKGIDGNFSGLYFYDKELGKRE